MQQASGGFWLTQVSGHRYTKWAFAVISFSLCAWALASQWSEVTVGLAEIGLWRTLASVPFMLLGLALGMLSWKILLGAMGSKLPLLDAASMYFMGQIGKYVPGSLWPVAAQMELGKHYRISRSRSATSILLAICVSMATGAALVVCAIPLLDPATAHRSVWLLLALPPLLAVLYPPLLWRMLRLVPQLGPSLALGPTPRVRDIGLAVAASLVGWAFYGVHIWVLMASFGPEYGTPSAFGLSVGGYAFAWVAGLLFFVLPAGAGARDLTLVVALSAVLPAQQGLALAVLSRGVSIVCDLGAAGLSSLRVKRLRERWNLAQEVERPTAPTTNQPPASPRR